MNPFFNVIVRAGQRIGLIGPNKMLGRGKANQVIATCNAFLNLRPMMTDADQARFTIGEGSAVLEIPRSGSGTSILLQTNSVNNPNQTILNLFAGTNITLSVDATGKVTIDAAKVRGGWRGVYDGATVYNAGDIVSSPGGVGNSPPAGLYGCDVNDTMGIFPSAGANWSFLVYSTASFNVCIDGANQNMVYHGLPPA